jgi:hypothetical protein
VQGIQGTQGVQGVQGAQGLLGDTLATTITILDGGEIVTEDGNVTFDDSGLSLQAGTGDVNQIRWLSGATNIFSIYGYELSSSNYGYFSVAAPASSSYWSQVRIRALGAAGQQMAAVRLNSGGAGSGGDISFCVDTSSSTYIVRMYNAFMRLFGYLSMTDGVTAPGTSAGYASIYVDTADGDLKVKFGDGTVKTLATDT